MLRSTRIINGCKSQLAANQREYWTLISNTAMRNNLAIEQDYKYDGTYTHAYG